MTTRNLFYAGAGSGATTVVLTETVATKIRGDPLFLSVVTAAAVANVIYKNQGYYAAGGVYESWITSGAPSTAAPSGHTLTGYSFVVLQA